MRQRPSSRLAGLMSLLKDNDAPLHYSDGSHRWIASDPDQQDAWVDKVKAHLEEHRRSPKVGYTTRTSQPPRR
jgi:hypothetical protein